MKLLPSRTVVLEILENVTPDAELVRACKELKRSGFRLALDDFSPHESKGELVEIADYVKVDFRASSPDTRQEIYKMFRDRKTTFVAEKVETLADVRTAQGKVTRYFKDISILDRRLSPRRKSLPSVRLPTAVCHTGKVTDG